MAKSRTISTVGAFSLTLCCLAMLELVIGEQRICGPGLRRTLDLVCPNGFNGYKAKRNSIMPEDEFNGSNDEGDNFAFNMDMFPFLSNLEANTLAKIRRRRHGIVHECCDKPCSIDELKSYCSTPPYK